MERTLMIEEKVIIGKDGKYPLEGILTLPDAPSGKCPALLLVHGSGPLNRDEKIGALTPFKDIAEYLATGGIATMRYDKRTFVYGKQLRKEIRTPTVRDETIEDALFAVNILKNDPRIDPDMVFIAGHSLGGMLASRIDAEGGDFAGIIIMAGSPRRLLDIIVDQNEAVLASLKGLTKKIAQKQVAKFINKLREFDALSDEESKNRKMIRICAYYFKEMEAHPASDYLQRYRKPMLILQGGKDFHVSVEKDFGGYQALLSDRENVKFSLYPELNHIFTPSVYGNIRKFKKEYKIPAKVDERVLEDIRDFILSA